MSEAAQLLVLTIALIALAWLLAAAETAFSRLSAVRLLELGDAGWRPAQRLGEMAADRTRYVNVLLLAHTALAFTALAVLVTALGAAGTAAPLLAATVAMSVVSYVVLGVSARTVGSQHPEKVAAATAGPTRVLAALLGWLAQALIVAGNAVTPGRGFARGPFASEAELRELLDAAGAADVIEDEERQMLHSVFELGDTITREVMVPRTEIVFAERGKTLRQALSLALRSGHSRLPVIGTGPDDVIGLVLLKDLVQRVLAHREAEATEYVESLVRPAQFVPDSKPVAELLRELQAAREHLAIVIDEFGGTAGLVTIEDILEEIVGEIADEYDTEAPEVVRLADGSLRLSARLPIEDLCEHTGLQLDGDELGVETIAGLLARRLGRVPLPGSAITEQGWRLVAETAEGRRNRIATVLAEPPETTS